MSMVGQSSSTDGGDSAAIAERSADVARTLEKPGIDGNQSDVLLIGEDEQPAKPATNSASVPNATDRLTSLPIDPAEVFQTVVPRLSIAAKPWQPQGRLWHRQKSSLRRA